MSGTEAVPASDGRQLTRWTRIQNYFRIVFLLRPSSRVLDPDWLPLAAQELDVEPTLKSSLLEGPPRWETPASTEPGHGNGWSGEKQEEPRALAQEDLW